MKATLWRRDGDRITLLGRDGVPLPEVPRRDPLCLVAFSVRPRSRTRAEVHAIIGDKFVFAGVVKDTELPEFVAGFVGTHPIYMNREAALLAMLRARWAVEMAHYMDARHARRGVAP